jgi:TRAP-type mannitol/chloroaromatic compound transport system permease small subunit
MTSSNWVYVFLFLGPVIVTLIYQAWISPARKHPNHVAASSIRKLRKITIIITTLVVGFVLLVRGTEMVIEHVHAVLEFLKTPLR